MKPFKLKQHLVINKANTSCMQLHIFIEWSKDSKLYQNMFHNLTIQQKYHEDNIN